MGEIAPPAILHSTDINRSSQDTQQLRASQTEPVRHGAGGGRIASLGFLTSGDSASKPHILVRKPLSTA